MRMSIYEILDSTIYDRITHRVRKRLGEENERLFVSRRQRG